MQTFFGLYARKDGELILMTKDHIVPKSHGGTNASNNLQTMCEECNNNKGNKIDLGLWEKCLERFVPFSMVNM